MKSKQCKHFLSELAHGAQKTHENAAQLFEEACLLREKGFLSRALFLHQISLEECAKVELMGTLAVSLLKKIQDAVNNS